MRCLRKQLRRVDISESQFSLNVSKLKRIVCKNEYEYKMKQIGQDNWGYGERSGGRVEQISRYLKNISSYWRGVWVKKNQRRKQKKRMNDGMKKLRGQKRRKSTFLVWERTERGLEENSRMKVVVKDSTKAEKEQMKNGIQRYLKI